LRPACPALIAATYPATPPPMMTRSFSSIQQSAHVPSHFHLSLQAPAYQLPRRILVAATCSGSRCWMRRMCCSRRGGSPSAGRGGPETGTLCKERAKQKPIDSCGDSAAMADVNGWVVGLEVVVELGRSAASTFPKSELGRGGQRRCGASHWSASSLANHHEDCTEGKTGPYGNCQ
jgi:hypothetical protein